MDVSQSMKRDANKRARLSILQPLAVGALFIAARMFGAPDPVFAEDDIDKGRKLVNRLCAGCHMVPGQVEKQGENDIPGFVAVSKRPKQSRHESSLGFGRYLQ